MTNPVTLKDVAQLAQVSTATVARVLHNNGYVAEETRSQVEAALEKTGYRINVVAQGLRKRQTYTLGHLLQSIVPNPFFASVALGVEEEARVDGYSVLIYNVHGDAERERQGVETLIKRRVDAILFTTAIASANVKMAADTGIPVVQVERLKPVLTHSVVVDNYVGSVAAVEHLIELGHRRIGYIGTDPDLQQYPRQIVEQERLAGYLDTLKRHQIPIEKELMVLGEYYWSLDLGFAHGSMAYMEQLLHVNPMPTAVIIMSDMLATGALQVLYQRGIRVPDDMSIIGFDDTHASHLSPPLTTVAQPMFDIGRAAARLAIEQLHDENRQSFQTRKLSTSLIIRASTGHPKR